MRILQLKTPFNNVKYSRKFSGIPYKCLTGLELNTGVQPIPVMQHKTKTAAPKVAAVDTGGAV